MSKKLFSSQRWKRYIKARQLAADRAARRKKKRSSGRLKTRKVTPTERRRLHVIVAPPRFSVVGEPAAAIAFLRNLTFYAERHHLSLDLSGVTHLTTDAVAAL